MAKQPTYGNGKICYIEIPANDISVSSKFFETVFGWHIRTNNEGFASFDDGVGEVSGTWVTGRKPMVKAGLLISIMVDDAEATIKLIEANGGTIVQPIGKDLPEITAHFTDPAGNLWGIYQHRG
ncbi:VOC family protein [Mucilaginibacter sp. SMC90]|uniref:VOC family protein n=1 Tax=Mucilaginibacter sp. SMC90 TaxID=2929803 RepID=UPI001FB56599|nr:VOC family protein [Mucilaginibacter sp. SMC90]UOE49634.1 VOC family protein [Mucilaginibacter sp. SMC90]